MPVDHVLFNIAPEPHCPRIQYLPQPLRAQFIEYPLYKFAADILLAAVLMASFRDYVKLVEMRYRSRVFFIVLPAVAYTILLGTFNRMVQFIHSYF